MTLLLQTTIKPVYQHRKLIVKTSLHKSSEACLVRPGSIAWWTRMLTVLLFVFHISYLRVHLLTEVHSDIPPQTASDSSHDDHDDDNDHQDSDHHKPHSALDHVVQMVAKHHDSVVAIDFLPLVALVSYTPAVFHVVRIPFENWTLPGDSPPDPLQPRAPPLS